MSGGDAHAPLPVALTDRPLPGELGGISGRTLLLSLDMGASSSKWALYRGGALVAEGRAAPLAAHLYTPAARQQLAHELSTLRRALPLMPNAVVAGVTGLPSEYAPQLSAELASEFGLSRSRVCVTDDMHLAYAAHFPSGLGTLVYAGTGSVAYHRTAAGEVVRAGGHGYLLDDAGGAFWQGRQGLKAALRRADEQQPDTPLTDALYAAVGSRHWPQIRAYVYGEGRAAVARLAPAVHGAALGGDPEALCIQRRAGQELARLCRAALRRSRSREVAAAGGAFNPLILAAFRETLDPAVILRPSVSPLLGGLALAPLCSGADLQGPCP